MTSLYQIKGIAHYNPESKTFKSFRLPTENLQENSLDISRIQEFLDLKPEGEYFAKYIPKNQNVIYSNITK